MKIELSEEQLKNLRVFLGRTQLQGSEVPVLVDLLNALNKKEVKDGSNEAVQKCK